MAQAARATKTSLVTAAQFVAAFRRAACDASQELHRIWPDKSTDAPYTTVMKMTLFPRVAEDLELLSKPELSYAGTSGARRQLDTALYHSDHMPSSLSIAVAIEIENKSSTLDQEIEKLVRLQTPLRVLFFYTSKESARNKWFGRIQDCLRRPESVAQGQFLTMWIQAYQSNPNWHPAVVSPDSVVEMPRIEIAQP